MKIARINIAGLERLEFSGVRDADGKLSSIFDNQGFEDWPEAFELTAACGTEAITFRLEETDDGVNLTGSEHDSEDVVSLAWYVPDTET